MGIESCFVCSLLILLGYVTRRPLPAELAATREQRIPPMTTQIQQRQEAAQNRQQFASVNHGRPAVVVATKPIPQVRRRY